jgi:hypothetical protein
MSSNVKYTHTHIHTHTHIYIRLQVWSAFSAHCIDTKPLFTISFHYCLSLHDILSLVLDNWYLCSLFLHSLPPQTFTLNLHIIYQLPPSQPSAKWQSYSIIRAPFSRLPSYHYVVLLPIASCLRELRLCQDRPIWFRSIVFSQFSDDSANNLSQQNCRAFLTISLNGQRMEIKLWYRPYLQQNGEFEQYLDYVQCICNLLCYEVQVCLFFISTQPFQQCNSIILKYLKLGGPEAVFHRFYFFVVYMT